MAENVETSPVLYTMLKRTEQATLASMEREVLDFVKGVLGSGERPMWTGGTASPDRMVRLLVPDQTPPVVLAMHPSELPDLTPGTLKGKLRTTIPCWQE